MAWHSRPIDRGLGRCDAARRGFSLAEGLIASVVLAVSVVSIFSAMSASMQHSAAQEENSAAIALARQLMEEIAAKPFNEPHYHSSVNILGPEPGETSRAALDNIDDYHGYTDQSTALSTLAGETHDTSRGQLYTRSVMVQYRSSPTATSGALSDPFLLVTVTVTTPSGQTVRLNQLFARTSLVR